MMSLGSASKRFNGLSKTLFTVTPAKLTAMSAADITQKRFDQVSAFDRGTRGCTPEGANFTMMLGEVIPCDCADENSIMITIALPSHTGSDIVVSCDEKVNGDYLEMSIIALWRLTNSAVVVTEGDEVQLTLLSLSATVFAEDQLSPDEIAYVRALAHDREVTVRAPPNFLVVRASAAAARHRILTAATQGWQLEFQQVDSSLSWQAPSSSEGTEVHAQQMQGNGPGTKKRDRSAAGESDNPDSNKKILHNTVTPAGTNSSTKVVQGLDGNWFAVSDAKAASKQVERLALAIRMASPARRSTFGVNRNFELKPEVVYDTIEHFHHRVRQLTDDELHWESTGGLSYMQGAAVFSDREVFERAITGQYDWRRVYALSLKSFHMDGQQAMFVDTGEKTSTSFFRVQVSHCLDGYERFLRIVFCPSYEGVMLATTAFLRADKDPCQSVPNVVVFHAFNSTLAHLNKILRTEERTVEASLEGPAKVRALIQEHMAKAVEFLTAAHTQDGQQAIATFFRRDLPTIEWSATSSLQDVAAQKSRMSAPGSGGRKIVTPPVGTKLKTAKEVVVKMEPSATTTHQYSTRHKQTALTGDTEASTPPAERMLCLIQLSHLLGKRPDKGPCKSKRCHHEHEFELADFTSLEMKAWVAAAAVKADFKKSLNAAIDANSTLFKST